MGPELKILLLLAKVMSQQSLGNRANAQICSERIQYA